MKSKFRVLVILSLLIMVFAFPTPANAAKLSKNKITISKGQTYTLKMKGAKKKVKWKSSNKRIATVSETGVVKGKRVGGCRITAIEGKKKYNCTVYVRPFDIKRYKDVETITVDTADEFFGVQLDHDPQLVWINEDYYCYGISDEYSIDYTVEYDYYDSTGTLQSWSSRGWDTVIYRGGMLHGYLEPADVPEGAFNIEFRFDDYTEAKLYLIKRSAVKKVIRPYTLILLNNKKLKSMFPIVN